MKQFVLSTIRKTHLMFRHAELPDRLAIYFHELESHQLSAFRDAIRLLTDMGYRTVSPSEYVATAGYDRRLFISFDDNFKSWHSALDTFENLGAKATFYVNTAPLRDRAETADIDAFFDRIRHQGDRTTLSSDELRDIDRAGHTIGCHTHTHPVLSSLDRGEWAGEISASKAILEQILGHAVTDFSYPFGMRRHFSDALRTYCANLGFKTIATGIPGLLHARNDALAIHRTGWKFGLELEENLMNLQIDGRLYAAITGRSVIG